MNAATDRNDAANNADGLLGFVLWSLSALGLEAEPGEEGLYVVHLPEADRDAFDGADPLMFSAGRLADSADSDASSESTERVEQLTTDGRLFKWVVERLSRRGPLHAVPCQQPSSVHELTPRVFERYDVENGHVHLAGCVLDDIPVFRLKYQNRASADGSPQFPEVFIFEDGQLADDDLQATLGLNDLQPLKRPPPRTETEQLRQLLVAARQRANAVMKEDLDAPIAEVVVWCKFARVKLAFDIGDHTRHIEFSGWARMIVDGLLELPPYTCPETGVASYRVAADDDGRITAAEAIAVCAESGRRAISSDLITCAATGRRVLASLTEKCPVSGERVARSAFVPCNMCLQQVSPTVVRSGKCLACRSLKTLTKAEPRMARVLDEYPGLDRWNHWKIAETETVYVLVATAFFRRLLVVVDQESLEPLRIATGSRMGSGWSDVPPITRKELLR